MSNLEVKKQMEYYLGDVNLARDEFFREKITSGKGGYLSINLFLNCNKLKKMSLNEAQIAEACVDSGELEVHEDKLQIRRRDNKPLPVMTGTMKKREGKVADKEEVKAHTNGQEAPKEVEGEPVIRDEDGKMIFHAIDFENTLIVHFKTLDQDEKTDENYKVNWKDFENMIKEKYEKLKVVYSRADKYEGDLAISSSKLNKEQYEALKNLKDVEMGEKKFTFSETEGEDLKEFWQK